MDLLVVHVRQLLLQADLEAKEFVDIHVHFLGCLCIGMHICVVEEVC